MVKVVFFLFFVFSIVHGAFFEEDNVTHTENPLMEKVKSFLNKDVYQENKKFIKIIFSPQIDYYKNNNVDVVKVITTLKENGLLKLFFHKPKDLQLHFKTLGPPLFFVKLMSDSLRNIGYYRYVTTSANFDGSEFTWSLSLKSEYATDPLILQEELNKNGCSIVDIKRISATQWVYMIDMTNVFLNVAVLEDHQKVILKRSIYPHWLDVSKIDILSIATYKRNHWYPYIAYYDKSLNLLNVVRNDRKTRRITLKIPKKAKYMKISDIYTLKNVTEDLILFPRLMSY
ncbi:FIG00638667: hypothetical protein [hydrothermal vent metagenome]|uniref:Periplasmic protein n=1 Tax=hydrothermal vent metagenome TaxID=652676 RepID=A0A1W1D1N8_9ZZZZ